MISDDSNLVFLPAWIRAFTEHPAVHITPKGCSSIFVACDPNGVL